ncbi:hypothetical protein K0M31_009490 [Melipona bicolor]|uniref:Uncharacterized protein n=1 Tax=Melipona bicolor TaxID=60889 RepID=A0AA40KJ72_9HYME|nr:hypothetical protein K0M31_009490 [Melipona bicolor]
MTVRLERVRPGPEVGSISPMKIRSRKGEGRGWTRGQEREKEPRQDEPWLRKFRSGLRKKRLTAARFTDDKSFKPFHRTRSAGSKGNLRSNCRQRYGSVVKQSGITGFPSQRKTKISRDGRRFGSSFEPPVAADNIGNGLCSKYNKRPRAKRYRGQPFYEATTNHDRKDDVTTAVLVVRSFAGKNNSNCTPSNVRRFTTCRHDVDTPAHKQMPARRDALPRFNDTNGATVCVYTCTQRVTHATRGNTFPHCASDSPSSDVLLYVHWPRRYVMYDKQHVLTCNEKKERVSVHTSCSCFDDPTIYLFRRRSFSHRQVQEK